MQFDHINEINQSTEQSGIYTTMKSILHLFKKVEESASMLRHWGGKEQKKTRHWRSLHIHACT